MSDLAALAERGAFKVQSIDVKAERQAFEVWWRSWCPDADMPSSASHIFDAWLASARAALKASPTTEPNPEGMKVGERVREACAKVCGDSAQQWRSFAKMGLPAMPDPAVCKVFAGKADELAEAIRAMPLPATPVDGIER